VSSAQLLLRRLLEQGGGGAETGYWLLLDGDGLEDLPDQMTTAKAVYAVHRVSTELGLRHLLWKAKGAPVIAVIPEALGHRLQRSPDLLRRAVHQRIHALSANDVLEVILGVRVVGADTPYLQQLAIEHIERRSLAISHRTVPTVIDRKLLTELLVDVSVGEQVRTQSPAQLLASWLQNPPRWSDNVGKLVCDTLPSLHGDEGRVLAWALAGPEERLRAVVIHGAVLTAESAEPPKKAWGDLWKAAAEDTINLDRRILRRTLTRLAEEALVALADAAGPLLDEADRVGREYLSPAQLQTSRILPLAFSDKCHSLAREAASGKAISAADMAWLSSHRAAPLLRSDLAVLEALARVTRFLDEPSCPKPDLVDQVRDYQRSGAFADLAMLQLKRALASSGHYHAEANKVLAAARDRRDRDNKHFAESLAQGYEAALHREGLTPLHRVWKRVVEPLWQQDAKARLFLVVLDGCSYPVFLELLDRLAQDSSFPVGIKPDTQGRVAGLPALSPLPTITSHSRGALFLGELPNDPLVAETVFRDQDEAKTDKARFNQNACLGHRSRRLFLKADLADGGQGLLAALEDEALDVIGAVFNAVDDQIGSANTGATVRLAPEDIAAFKPALRAALKAGRRVLLTADHGHTPYVDKNLRAGTGKGARFLSLGKHDPVPEGFLELDLAGLGGPPERRGFAWRTGAYLNGPQVGFHGGCSLEEMVVPLAWLERDGLHADEPSWWFGAGVLAEPVREAPPISSPVVTPLPSDELPPKPPAQRSLFDLADRADSLPLPAALLAKLTADEKSVLVLLKQNGSARASELAERLKKNPGRLNGLMRTLNRTLFEAGEALFAAETLPTGETMYLYKPKEKR